MKKQIPVIILAIGAIGLGAALYSANQQIAQLEQQIATLPPICVADTQPAPVETTEPVEVVETTPEPVVTAMQEPAT